MLRGSYAHLLVLLGICMFCIVTSADVCNERYRLLHECNTHPPFLAAPFIIQDSEEVLSDSNQDSEEMSHASKIEQQLIGVAKDFFPKDEIEELLAKKGKGSAQTQFGTSFGSQATGHRASEVYRASGLFDLRVTYEY